ncbi:MAG: VanZ family protein [Phycisphaeraceae bacterium]|nr:MAG: VanZ family protein [Phycisphaeraceae bacterium]
MSRPRDTSRRAWPWIAPQWLRRTIFALYAVALFLGTHWPQLDLGEAPVRHFDKLLHFGAFGAWTCLLVGCSFFGPALSKRNLRWCLAIALFYAGLDELLQVIPALNRQADWWDYGANTLGVLCAMAACLVLRGTMDRAARETG